MTSWSWLGVVGLKLLSAIVRSPLQTGGHVDGVALFEGHDSALDVSLYADRSFESLYLADMGVDALDLDVEELLDRFLDLRLRCIERDLEHHLAALGSKRRLFGNDRRENDVVVARIGRRHLNRASNASRAALVRTKVRRRRMS